MRLGDVVIMDNLNFHKMKVVREAIEATPIYLPTYSPKRNPI
ncbi:MAG: transposase [Deltaproteobacteria bacterium]|nr:transposase [Deltaproteobacteria bacterium]